MLLRSFVRRCLIPLSAVFALISIPQSLRANSDIFPPADAAKASIDFDGAGFIINGQRTWIASGSLHYPRVPRALWRDRLLKIKRGGFNCVQTYAFWNYHEVKEGEFDFKDEKDFGAFLDLAHELGLYVVVRPGPYVCAEWENGGYPVWLRFKPDVLLRTNNPAFLAATDAWYDQVFKIVAPRQIHKGGSVIMVQLENEYPYGWGTDMNPYFQNLLDRAHADGLEIPLFFSGLHHGGNPAPGNPEKVGDRKSPWYTTEFWTGWYDIYGMQEKGGDRSVYAFDRGIWRILENGGDGYNFYMLHGGTNFATWNDDEDKVSTSYDYGAAIGQTGDLRTLYYRMKRINIFAHSFQNILANSDDSTDANKDITADVKVAARTARSGATGTIVFLDNTSEQPVTAHLSDGASIQLDGGEVTGLVRDFSLDAEFSIVSSDARIYGVLAQGPITTVIVHGLAGDTAKIDFKAAHPANLRASTGIAKSADGTATLTATIQEGDPQEFDLVSSGRALRVLVMTKDLADRTWFVDSAGDNYVVCGPKSVGDFSVQNGQATLTTEEPLADTAPEQVLIYGAGAKPAKATESAPGADPAPPDLSGSWRTATAALEADPKFNDATWKASDQPLPMGADGDTSAYAWYRASFTAPQSGKYWLQAPYFSDHAEVFVNGQIVPTPDGHPMVEQGPLALHVDVNQGDNTLAILVSHSGREKFFNTLGPIEKMDIKGLEGPVTLSKTQRPLLPVVKGEINHTDKDTSDQSNDGPSKDWKGTDFPFAANHYSQGGWGNEDFGRGGTTWFRAKLPNFDGPKRIIHFGFIYNKGTVYLNGQSIGEAPGAGASFDLPLELAWKEGQDNVLSVQTDATTGFGGMMGHIYLTSQTPDIAIKGWKMRGNVQDPQEAGIDWQDVPDKAPGIVTFYQAKFTYTPDPSSHPIFRFSNKGLSRGFVWINGHNIGRYPEQKSIDGLYLPECWIKPGDNILNIVDEEGASPSQARLYVETGASHRISNIEIPLSR
jgi:beta-galactosidase